MGPPPDPEDMIRMLQNPQFASTLNEALSNPQLIDTMIQQNPVLREMGPQVRQMMQTPEFRRMMTDPERLRDMMQMQRMFGGGSMGLGGAGNEAFPAPGQTDTTPGGDQGNRQAQQGGAQQQQQRQPPAFNPYGMFGQGMNPQQGQGQGQAGNPFAALFNPSMFGNLPGQTPPAAASAGEATATEQTAAGGQQQGTAQSQTQSPPQQGQQQQNPFSYANPLLQNPQLLSQLLSAYGQGAANPNPTSTDAQNPQNPQQGQQQQQQNPFANLFNAFGMGGFGGAAPAQNPPDSRPPEERYAEQLRQLNDMGFYQFERNVEALRRSGGSVQGAVEYLLTH